MSLSLAGLYFCSYRPIFLTSISAIPLILLIIVYPAEIVCALIIGLSAATMITTVVLSLLDSAGILPDGISPGGISPGGVSNWRVLNKWNQAFFICIQIMAVFFTISLAAMLISLLYLKVLVARATTNVVVYLFLGTALISVGLVFGTRKALKMYIRTLNRIHVDDEVYLITPSATNKQSIQLIGPYTVICSDGNGRFRIKNQSDQNEEGIAIADVLLKDSELHVPPPQPPKQPESIEFHTGDEVYHITSSETKDWVGCTYKVIRNIGKGRYLIKDANITEDTIANCRIVNADELLKNSELHT